MIYKIAAFTAVSVVLGVVTCAALGYDPLDPNKEVVHRIQVCKDPDIHTDMCK